MWNRCQKLFGMSLLKEKTLIWWGLNFCRNNLTPIANYDKHKRKQAVKTISVNNFPLIYKNIELFVVFADHQMFD